jgi:hypothetical protein
MAFVRMTYRSADETRLTNLSGEELEEKGLDETKNRF